MRSRKRYISVRHVQKLSAPGPPRSVSPASARWKACECTFGMPGMSGPWRRSASAGAANATSTARIEPSPSTSTRTSCAQPEGNSASRANSFMISLRPPVPRGDRLGGVARLAATLCRVSPRRGIPRGCRCGLTRPRPAVTIRPCFATGFRSPLSPLRLRGA